MPRLQRSRIQSGKRILLVDDQEDYAKTTAGLIEREGHEVVTVPSGEEALKALRAGHFDLVLLDYYMPGGMTGEDVVTELRKFNSYVQVILQTGYAGEYPPREMLQRLDIQGFHDKTDGPDKLLLWVDVGLKVAYMVQLLHKSRQGLRYILEVTPDLHKIQTVEDLLQGILYEISGLLGAVNTFVAVWREGKAARPTQVQTDAFVAIMEEEAGLTIRMATGKFTGQPKLEDCLDAKKLKTIQDVLQKKQIQIASDCTILPLGVGDVTLGVIYLDQIVTQKQDIELLQVFANQAAVALQNTRLYEMATIDPLTGVFVRRYFEQCLLRELRSSFRMRQPLTVLMIDMDHLKTINDTAGHIAGDRALAIMGKVLRKVMRSADIVARFGGDEFTLILPQTPLSSANIVSGRILETLQDQTVEGPNGPIPVQASIGIAGLEAPEMPGKEIPRPIPPEYWEGMSQVLVKSVDQMLYQAKKKSDQKIHIGPRVEWLPMGAKPKK